LFCFVLFCMFQDALQCEREKPGNDYILLLILRLWR